MNSLKKKFFTEIAILKLAVSGKKCQISGSRMEKSWIQVEKESALLSVFVHL